MPPALRQILVIAGAVLLLVALLYANGLAWVYFLGSLSLAGVAAMALCWLVLPLPLLLLRAWFKPKGDGSQVIPALLHLIVSFPLLFAAYMAFLLVNGDEWTQGDAQAGLVYLFYFIYSFGASVVGMLVYMMGMKVMESRLPR